MDPKTMSVLEKKGSEVSPRECEKLSTLSLDDDRKVLRKIDLCLLPFMVSLTSLVEGRYTE